MWLIPGRPLVKKGASGSGAVRESILGKSNTSPCYLPTLIIHTLREMGSYTLHLSGANLIETVS